MYQYLCVKGAADRQLILYLKIETTVVLIFVGDLTAVVFVCVLNSGSIVKKSSILLIQDGTFLKSDVILQLVYFFFVIICPAM